MDFQNGQNSKTFGWVLNIGYAHLDWEGWRMHSRANGVGVPGSNTRVHFDGGNAQNPYFFNTAKNPKTSIMVWLRGAPDAGYVLLRSCCQSSIIQLHRWHVVVWLLGHLE